MEKRCVLNSAKTKTLYIKLENFVQKTELANNLKHDIIKKNIRCLNEKDTGEESFMENEILAEQIIDVPIGVNTSYILKNENMFYDIGFHVMKNQKIGSLLPCRKIRYNGKIKLVYLTEDKFSFQRFLAETEVENIYMVIHNLFHAIEEIQNNGFLNIVCIDSSLSKIFVESNTLAVKLVYIPLNITITGYHKNMLVNNVRSRLVKELQTNRWAFHPKIQDITNILMNGTLGLSDLVRVLADMMSSAGISVMQQPSPTGTQGYLNHVASQITLCSTDNKHSFHINKDDYSIGKNPDKVDGVIIDNPIVSRIHCRILRRGSRYFIMDAGSANGTFVDNRRLMPNEEAEISAYSKIRIANMEFIVK